jgi:hypothetical protein
VLKFADVNHTQRFQILAQYSLNIELNYKLIVSKAISSYSKYLLGILGNFYSTCGARGGGMKNNNSFEEVQRFFDEKKT